jgi:hypothetical protein
MIKLTIGRLCGGAWRVVHLNVIFVRFNRRLHIREKKVRKLTKGELHTREDSVVLSAIVEGY